MAKTSKSDIQAWLAEKMRSQGRSSTVAGYCVIGLGLVALFVQFLMMSLLIWGVSLSFGGLSFWPCVFLGLIGTGLLFAGNKFSSTDDLDEIQGQIGSDRIISGEQLRAVGYGALSAFSSFEDAPAIVKFVTTPLFMGPRIIMAGAGMLKQGKALKEFDHIACGRVLNSLIRAGKRIPFEQFGEKFGDMNLETILPQLMLLDGVILLKSTPIGLTTGPGLVEEFNEWHEKRIDADD